MASRYPAHGDFVVVEECEFVSGNSSVPFAVATGEYLGTLTRVDDTTYGLVDDDGSVVVAIPHVYEGEEDGWFGLWGGTFSPGGSRSECPACDGSRTDAFGESCHDCDGEGWQDCQEGYSCCDTA